MDGCRRWMGKAGKTPSEPEMRDRQSKALSFVIRLWCEEEADGRKSWKARIEHIQTGQTKTFNNVEDLLDYLKGHVASSSAGR